MPDTPHYDGLLVLSFGGPEGREDVLPFLENVLRGKNVPRERMVQVAEHYYLFDGKSPINGQNRALVAALKDVFALQGPQIPIYWGNRNWHPMLEDTVRQMTSDGVRRALVFVTSAYSSYSGCRQYREDILRAQESIGPHAPEFHKLRTFYNHPGFIGPLVKNVRQALSQIPENQRSGTHLAFTAHSIPSSMADTSRYGIQLEEACRLIASEVGSYPYRLVFQSRSGPPTQPWLEPDILDHLNSLHEAGVSNVVAIPVGFVSDHLEILFDLDTQARERANSLGIRFVRAATPGTDPDFVAMVRELVLERLNEGHPRASLGIFGPGHDVCAADCCPAPRRPA